MKCKLVTTLIAIVLASNAFAGYYRVFYQIRGEPRREPAYHGSMSGSSKEDVRRKLLKLEPRAIEIKINKLDWGDN
jgi:hypothetical protein